jgi:hypothetical protein
VDKSQPPETLLGYRTERAEAPRGTLS